MVYKIYDEDIYKQIIASFQSVPDFRLDFSFDRAAKAKAMLTNFWLFEVAEINKI